MAARHLKHKNYILISIIYVFAVLFRPARHLVLFHELSTVVTANVLPIIRRDQTRTDVVNRYRFHSIF